MRNRLGRPLCLRDPVRRLTRRRQKLIARGVGKVLIVPEIHKPDSPIASLAALGQKTESAADRETARGLARGKVMAVKRQAWSLVNRPARRHIPDRTLRLAQLAVQREPNNSTHLNTRRIWPASFSFPEGIGIIEHCFLRP